MIDFMNHEHLPETIELFKFISELDFENGDYFYWKSGGDGDNGEVLMNELDEYFLKNRSTVEVLNKSIENNWHDLRKDPTDLPTEDGWYNCWIRIESGDKRYTVIDYGMDLYYYTDSKKFIDNRRENVFDMYDVMAFDFDAKDPFGKVKIWKDDLCDRTSDVIAWKEMEVFEG